MATEAMGLTSPSVIHSEATLGVRNSWASYALGILFSAVGLGFVRTS